MLFTPKKSNLSIRRKHDFFRIFIEQEANTLVLVFPLYGTRLPNTLCVFLGEYIEKVLLAGLLGVKNGHL